MNVLIDTSVWVEHFKHKNTDLVQLCLQDMALIHPMIIGELACGTPPAPREKTLSDLALLSSSQQASQSEVIAFIERETLYGLGCGLIDITLLASTMMTANCLLWTFDKRLQALAKRFDVSYVHDGH